MTVMKVAIKWSIRLVTLVYGLLVLDDIISCVAPVFYRKLFSLLRLYQFIICDFFYQRYPIFQKASGKLSWNNFDYPTCFLLC